MKADAAVIT